MTSQFWIEADQVFIWTSFGVKGTSHFVDTDNSAHVYRVEQAGDGNYRIFYDDSLIIADTQWTYGGAVPRVGWGKAAGDPYGTAKWLYVKHNAERDHDLDGLVANCDNCPFAYNPSQTDTDANGIGDTCEASFTSVETDSAMVTQVVTADLDLDTYTDVVFLGETGVGLFVSWGQAGDPLIGEPDSVAR